MTANFTKPWTEQDDEFVRAGVVNGLSLREMGDAIGRTRNSVVNRIRVLGIIRPAVVLAAAASADEEEIEWVSCPVRLIDASASVCHWPLWQKDGTPDFMVCGAPGYPYCTRHHHIATSARSLTSLTSLEG